GGTGVTSFGTPGWSPSPRPSPREGRGEGERRERCSRLSGALERKFAVLHVVQSSRREPLTPTLSPQEAGRGSERAPLPLLRDLIDLRHLLRAQRPADGFHVLLDLFDAGGAGDDAGDLRALGEPGEGEFEHVVAAGLRERLQLFDDVLVTRGDVAVLQRRRLGEAGVGGRGGAALVFAGEEPARQREERQ